MERSTLRIIRTFLQFALLCLAPSAAFAYVGPGAGLTAIGAALALVGAILLGIVGFFWYPLKRLFGRGEDEDDEFADDLEEGDALVKRTAQETESQDR